jgi:FkbM family methyltransferase
MKQLIRRILNWGGYDLRRIGFSRDLMDFIRVRDIETVLDVGANVGQFGESLRAKGYRGKIISFEPIPSVFKTLAVKASADSNWQANNFALGARAGTATINVAEMSVFSSILPFTGAAARHNRQASVAGRETIEVRTLDDIYPSERGNVLLKIDTQGYEKPVLEGGRSVLPMLKGVLMELPIIHLYEGTWQFHQAIEFMADAGFVPAQIHPVGYHSTDSVSLIEVDCLFRPRDDRID